MDLSSYDFDIISKCDEDSIPSPRYLSNDSPLAQY